MYEMSNRPVNFDADRIDCLKLNPLLLEKHKNVALAKDFDLDSNFFSDTLNCDYFIENTLNEMLKRKIPQSSLIVYLYFI